MENSNKQKIIITIILSVTFLFAGWTAGSSLGYKRGYAEAERLNLTQKLDSTKAILPEVKLLLDVAAQARHDLLIRYKNIPDRDFGTIMAAHQKTSAKLCEAYETFSKSEPLMQLCKDTIIPTVKKARRKIDNFLVENGLN